MAKRKISPLQNFAYILEYIAAIALGGLLTILPWKIARAFGNSLGKLLYRIDRRDRDIACRNLDIIYEKNPLSMPEKAKLIKVVFQNVVRLAIEYLKRGDITKENYRKFATLEGLENLDEALSHKKGVIVVTAHMGNFEYLGDIPAKLGYKVGVIINRQFNPYSDVWLKNIREKKGGMTNFYNEIFDLTRVIKFLKGGGIVAIPSDQTYYFRPIFVPFFGRKSATADGPAKLHLKFGAPLIFAYSVLQPDGRYLMRYEKPVSFKPTGDMEKDCITVMTWVNQQFERIVRENPDQWFSLLHDRWERTKPEDFNFVEAPPY